MLNEHFFARIRQAASRLEAVAPPPQASETDIAALAERLHEQFGVSPAVTTALAIAGHPRREYW